MTVLRKQTGELVSRNESGCFSEEIQHQSEENAALFDELAERRQSAYLSEREIADLRRKSEGRLSVRMRRVARHLAGSGAALLRKALPSGASHNLASRWFRMLNVAFRPDLDPRRSPVPLDPRFRSEIAPFVAFKRELCRSLPLDLSGLSSRVVPGMVSVVLPVYNGAGFLRESIESVLAQEYQPLELIVVDDGSTDETPAIVAEYAGKDERVRPVRQHNQRLPAALNNGFAAARGEFYTWTSADNAMRPKNLSTLVSFLRRNSDVELVYADTELMDETGRPIRNSSEGLALQWPPRSEYIRAVRDPGVLKSLRWNPVGACFMYRSWAAKIAGNYAEGTFGFEDYEYWTRMNSLFRLAHLGTEECLYKYRLHSGSLTARKGELRIDENAAAFRKVDQERSRYFLRPFIVHLVGEHPWLSELAGIYRENGLRVIEWPGNTDGRPPFHGSGKTILLAGPTSADRRGALSWMNQGGSGWSLTAALADEPAMPGGLTSFDGFQWVIATTPSSWEVLQARTDSALLAASPACLAYPLLALANRLGWERLAGNCTPRIDCLGGAPAEPADLR